MKGIFYMGKMLVLAEKPSVGRDIARVLGCTNRGEGCITGEMI
jgi:DNA topoisomerase-3